MQDVALYLREKRDYLTRAPGPGLLLHRGVPDGQGSTLYAWAKYVVPMDPGDLVLAEQAMARGETSENRVRLPESVGAGGRP